MNWHFSSTAGGVSEVLGMWIPFVYTVNAFVNKFVGDSVSWVQEKIKQHNNDILLIPEIRQVAAGNAMSRFMVEECFKWCVRL